MNRSKTIEAMAIALYEHATGMKWSDGTGLTKGKMVEFAEVALAACESHIQAEGMAVVPGWQPIDSAPKDQTTILLGHPSHAPEAAWWEHCSWFEGWCCGGFRSDMYGPGFEPTLWMPMIPPPASPYGKAGKEESK